MRKALIQIIFCFFLMVFNLAIHLYPIGKIYTKHYACNLNLNDYLKKMKNSEYLFFLDETEKEQLNILNEFQREYCIKNQIK